MLSSKKDSRKIIRIINYKITAGFGRDHSFKHCSLKQQPNIVIQAIVWLEAFLVKIARKKGTHQKQEYYNDGGFLGFLRPKGGIRIPKWLRTHPPTEERVERLRKLVPKYESEIC